MKETQEVKVGEVEGMSQKEIDEHLIKVGARSDEKGEEGEEEPTGEEEEEEGEEEESEEDDPGKKGKESEEEDDPGKGEEEEEEEDDPAKGKLTEEEIEKLNKEFEEEIKGKTPEEVIEIAKKQRRRIVEKERTIGRQSKEVGKTRKELEKLEVRLGKLDDREKELKGKKKLEGKDLADKLYDNPEAVLDQRDENKKEEEEQRAIMIEKRTLINKRYLLTNFPGFDKMVPEIADMLKAEGELDEAGVSRFKDNPYLAPVQTLFPYIIKVVGKGKDGTITGLEKKLKDTERQKGQIGERIAETIKKSPKPISSKTGKSGKAVKGITEAQIPELSGKDLKKTLAERLRAEESD